MVDLVLWIKFLSVILDLLFAMDKVLCAFLHIVILLTLFMIILMLVMMFYMILWVILKLLITSSLSVCLDEELIKYLEF